MMKYVQMCLAIESGATFCDGTFPDNEKVKVSVYLESLDSQAENPLLMHISLLKRYLIPYKANPSQGEEQFSCSLALFTIDF